MTAAAPVSYHARTHRLASVALHAAGQRREPTADELAVVDAWRGLGATISRLRFVIRHLNARGGFDLVGSAAEVAGRLQAARKWPGAA